MGTNLPIIDIEKCGILVDNDKDVNETDLLEVGNKLFESFATAGCAYIKNHGIEERIVQDMFKVGDSFFDRSLEYKMEYCTKGHALCYDPLGSFYLDPTRPFDYNEGLRIPMYGEDEWPDIGDFKIKVSKFQEMCGKLIMRLLKALGRGLKTKNKDILCEYHDAIGEPDNYSSFKFLRYPPITDDVTLQENQLRVGTHTDFGTMTVLFQDDMGGLQFQSSSGEFADVTPVPGTAILNIGDMLEILGGGRLRPGRHQVIIPTDKKVKEKHRRSLAYFGVANNDVIMKELDFDDAVTRNKPDTKYPTAYEHWMKRFTGETFPEERNKKIS